MEYNGKKEPIDGLPDEDVTTIDEIPVRKFRSHMF